jgi:hypothetical protein
VHLQNKGKKKESRSNLLSQSVIFIPKTKHILFLVAVE